MLKFGEWYSHEITKQLEKGIDVYNVQIDTTLTVMKPIHARWIIGLYDKLRNLEQVIIKGFDQAGISDAIDLELDPEDPFIDLN